MNSKDLFIATPFLNTENTGNIRLYLSFTANVHKKQPFGKWKRLILSSAMTSVPSKNAKNVGAEVHTDFGADKIGQKCGRRSQL